MNKNKPVDSGQAVEKLLFLELDAVDCHDSSSSLIAILVFSGKHFTFLFF